jgi:hypothetical protein
MSVVNRNNQLTHLDTITGIVKTVLENLMYDSPTIDHLLEKNEMITVLKNANGLFNDFKITVPYSGIENVFDLGQVLDTAHQDKIEIYFDNKSVLKEVKVIYRDEPQTRNIIIILNCDLEFYDFVIKYDDVNEPIRQKAVTIIKEELFKLSKVFKAHQSVLISMIDDILYNENEYFCIEKTNLNQISYGTVNSFKLLTTAIYSGINNQHAPVKYRSRGSVINGQDQLQETCEILFDNQQKIVEVAFKIIRKQNITLDKLIILFDENMQIKDFQWDVLENLRTKTQRNFNYTGLSANDSLDLLKLKFNFNDTISEIFPELTIPSAYNFQDNKYKDRLLLVDMLLD